MEINEIKKDHFEIQKAIKFLIDKLLDEDGNQIELHTDKPLVMHSLKVGLILLDHGYDKEIVMAGILHDVNEDADVTFDEIEKKFSKRVADLVHAVSVDRTITDGAERHKDLHDREIATGKDAIIVAIADHISNIPYLKYAATPELHDLVKSRWFVFLDEVAVLAKDEPIYKDYKEKMEQIR